MAPPRIRSDAERKAIKLASNRRRRAIFKANGLCPNCGNILKKHNVCNKCRISANEYAATFVLNRRLRKVCPLCASKLDENLGFYRCLRCTRESCIRQNKKRGYKQFLLGAKSSPHRTYVILKNVKLNDPLLRNNWAEAKDWIADHAELFHDKSDRALDGAVELRNKESGREDDY